MKLVSLKAAVLLFATISLVSCKDDDDKKAPDNKFTVGDDTYKISESVFLKDLSVGHDANENPYYRNSVIFVTEGVNVTTSDGHTNASGAGEIVELMLNNEGQELEAGTYTWESEENEQPFDFWAGYITLGWKSSDEEAGTELEFTSGTVVVAKSGDQYTITFEGVAEGDLNHDGMANEEANVSGKFEGKLTVGERDF